MQKGKIDFNNTYEDHIAIKLEKLFTMVLGNKTVNRQFQKL